VPKSAHHFRHLTPLSGALDRPVRSEWTFASGFPNLSAWPMK
jgi:hypothetical protein